jgi:Zn-dependent oligopeptidase
MINWPMVQTQQFKFANNPETRRRAQIASEGRLANNVQVLDEALALRRELANILKYPTWADFVTEDKVRLSWLKHSMQI